MSKLLSIANTKEIEALVAYLRAPGNVELADDLKIKLDQLDFCDNQIRNCTRRTEAAGLIARHYNISRPRAYQLILETEYVYGSVNRFGKEYYRQFLIEKAMVELNKFARNSNADGFNKTLKNLITLFGFDKNEDNAVTADILQEHNYIFNISFKNDKENYQLNIKELHAMPLKSRMEIIKQVEAESIDFEMLKDLDEKK